MNEPIKAEKPNETSASSGPEPKKKPEKSANPWDAIAVGSTVLAQVDKAEGYFPAIVQKISGDGKTLTLRWKGFDMPAFTMRRLAVGLIAVVK